MRLFSILLMLCALPFMVGAQDYGDEGVSLTFSQVWLIGNGRSGPDILVFHIVPVPGNGFLEYQCGAGETEVCFAIHYVNYPNATAFGTVPVDMPPADALALMSPIITRDYVGDVFLPPKDGATATWVEVWDSPEFQAEYEMSASMLCCVPAPDFALAQAETQWTLTFSYENAGTFGDAHGGSMTQFYDTEIRAFGLTNAINWHLDRSDMVAYVNALTDLSARGD